MHNTVIIEATFNLGLKQLTPQRPPGVYRLPAWLQQHGFYEHVSPERILNLPSPVYHMDIDPETGIQNADAIVDYTKSLAVTIESVLNEDKFPIVIGGDCSILLGCMVATRKFGNYGLFFIDGHTDYVTVEFSATKAAAGMDLALVTGNGPNKLTNIDGLSPYVHQTHTIAFGNRYEEKTYVDLIRHSGITYCSLEEARETGVENIAARYLDHARANNLDGIWIHLDVDVLDDTLMPCVDSRQLGGLSYTELGKLLFVLFQSNLVTGIDITILDPDLDPEAVYTRRFVKEMGEILRMYKIL